MNQQRASLCDEVKKSIEQDGVGDASLLAILDQCLSHLGCSVGTIHDVDRSTGLLRLRAQRGIPAAIMDRVRSVPFGKGMAGIAAERREPVQVCNLQTDASGVAKPGAKETRMEGSIAVPMMLDGQVHGVLGVTKPLTYEFTASEIAELVGVASLLAVHLP